MVKLLGRCDSCGSPIYDFNRYCSAWIGCTNMMLCERCYEEHKPVRPGKKIKRFKLRDGVTMNSIRATHKDIREGGAYMTPDSEWFLCKTLHEEIEANICFPHDLSRWNDFDHIILIDEDFGQPYEPFYGQNYGREINDFPFLEDVIESYNAWLSSLDFLEESGDESSD